MSSNITLVHMLSLCSNSLLALVPRGFSPTFIAITPVKIHIIISSLLVNYPLFDVTSSSVLQSFAPFSVPHSNEILGPGHSILPRLAPHPRDLFKRFYNQSTAHRCPSISKDAARLGSYFIQLSTLTARALALYTFLVHHALQPFWPFSIRPVPRLLLLQP